MFNNSDAKFNIDFLLSRQKLEGCRFWLEKHALGLIIVALGIISIYSFIFYYQNGLGLAYNDARSHLDTGRRVVEGLKTGLAQLGTVWLPLMHLLMVLTVWNDFMWHSGLAGALQSMAAFVGTGILIYLFLKELNIGFFGRFFGVIIFAANLNVLYLQSTAMTELVLIGTMMAGSYNILRWVKTDRLSYLIYAAFWIMLSTLVRYDGWFLLLFSIVFVFLRSWKQKGYGAAEGIIVLFCTLGGLGIALWFLWNLLIFKDPLYFAFGPYSAYAQQKYFESAGILSTKYNWYISIKTYLYALFYNSGAFTVILGFVGFLAAMLDKVFSRSIRIATFFLAVPLVFNIIALYFGHSTLFIQGLSGNTWFNVRYGIMLAPFFAIFIGYLFHRAVKMRPVFIGLFALVLFFSIVNNDAVTVEDAIAGTSQKNVSESSGWLKNNAKDAPGFVLISAASHDAVIFSSGLPMEKFIHEGTGDYYASAIENPDIWARWIVVKTGSDADSTWRAIKDNPNFGKFDLVGRYTFSDIYQLKKEYLNNLITKKVFSENR